jgi:hypothetical protein
MINPSEMRMLGKEHGSEILKAALTARAPDALGSRVRRRLGWSLIGLGVHLALDGGKGRGPEHRQGRPTPIGGSLRMTV